MSPEVSAFYARFSETLRHADAVLDENYVGAPQNPVVIPPVKPDEDIPPFSANSAPTEVTVQLKSIRSPKFSVEYQVSSQSSVFALKERLLTDPNQPIPPASEYHHPTSVKLLLKSKVVTDTKQLRELPSLSFTVMLVRAEEQLTVPLAAPVYWSPELRKIAANAVQSSPTLPSIASQTKREYPGITDQFWTEVTNVAKKYVPNPTEIVDQLRLSYEAANDLD